MPGAAPGFYDGNMDPEGGKTLSVWAGTAEVPGRPSLASDHGMLFLFERPDFHGIWMKNCKFPIDILWLDADHKVVHLAEKVPPCTAKEDSACEVYHPLARASFVVELNAGQARREKALVGSTVTFKLPE